MKKTVRQYPLQRSPIYRLGRRRDLEELLYMQKGDSRRVKCFSEYNIFDKEKSSGGKQNHRGSMQQDEKVATSSMGFDGSNRKARLGDICDQGKVLQGQCLKASV